MKLITLVLALFSFSAFAGALDCRENSNGSQYSYKIHFEGTTASSIEVEGLIFPARSLHNFEDGKWMVYISTETSGDIYEFSYQNNGEHTPYRFFNVTLTTYYGGSRPVLCRFNP